MSTNHWQTGVSFLFACPYTLYVYKNVYVYESPCVVQTNLKLCLFLLPPKCYYCICTLSSYDTYFYLSFLRQRHTVWPWLSWNNFCRQDWLRTLDIHLAVSGSFGIKGTYRHIWSNTFFFCIKFFTHVLSKFTRASGEWDRFFFVVVVFVSCVQLGTSWHFST